MIVEVNACYIKGMLANPDIMPSTSINHWIVSILSFHFTLVHVAGTHHGPDRLSQCDPFNPKIARSTTKKNLVIGLSDFMASYIRLTISGPAPFPHNDIPPLPPLQISVRGRRLHITMYLEATMGSTTMNDFFKFKNDYMIWCNGDGRATATP